MHFVSPPVACFLRPFFSQKFNQRKVRLGYYFTPYRRLWLYNGAPLVAFYDTLGIRRMFSRLKPRRPNGVYQRRR